MNELADAAARKLIEERLDLNVLVEAGAGSGKTYSLAHRMAAGVVSGKYRIEELAAVTFTRKAAAELRGRFQLALEEGLGDARGEQRPRIEAALASLEHLFAGTIHSFCAHLLRERPVEAGIAPGFLELDELEDERFRQRSWRDYLSRLRGEQSPLLEELQLAGVSAQDLDRAFGVVCTFDEVDFPPGSAEQPGARATMKAAVAFLRRLQALMPADIAPEARCETLKRARKFRGLMRAAAGGRPADLAEALRCWEKPPALTKKWWAAGQERQDAVRAEVERLVQAFKEGTVVPFLTAWRQYVYRLSMALLSGARDSAREERRRALSLNYGDLLTAAAALLRGNASVRAALRRKYLWLLVDEFQDTDPIQADVMLLLAGEEDGESLTSAAGIDPYAIRLRPGALFVVGDPKQSIYRFRRADIDVYNRVREAMRRGGGEVVALTTSFRARPSLCRWTNRVFERQLPGEASAHQAAFSPLEPNPGWKPRRVAASDDAGLRTLTVPADVASRAVAEWDARAIARFIRSEVDAGRAAWQDFLVLTRKRKHLVHYAWALEERQVPVEVSGAGAFGGSDIARSLIELLRALGDPADKTAVVGVLRGPLFGISDAELYEHRRGNGHFGLSAAVPDAGDEVPATRTRVEAALQRMGALLGLARSLPPAAAVECILEQTGLLALAAASAAGAAPAGDLLHAVDLVRSVAERGGGFSEAAAALEDAAESSSVESVPLEPGRRDVVRVMNLHKAKGLEAAVVFLADPLGGVKKSADVRIVRDGSAARGYLAVARDVNEFAREVIAQPQGWDEHREAEMTYVEAEETRLLYVAATRARELLVVSRWGKDSKAQRPWAGLDEHLAGVPEIAIPPLEPPSRGGRADTSAAARARAETLRRGRREEAGKASWAVASVTGGKAAREAEGGKAQAEKAEEGKAEGGYPGGAAWGALVHGLLEWAARGAAGRLELERLALWLTMEDDDLRPAIPEAVDLVLRLAASPEWAEIQASTERCVEVPFAVDIPAGESLAGVGSEETATVLRGVIDLVYRSAGGWRILDYKTDRFEGDPSVLLERHGPQLDAYARAWERVTGEPVARRGIFVTRAATIVWAV